MAIALPIPLLAPVINAYNVIGFEIKKPIIKIDFIKLIIDFYLGTFVAKRW
jgi:hypothetical protein